MVETFTASVSMLSDRATDGELTLECCIATENVCHSREGHDTDFFFMYACFFTDSQVCIPFDEFKMGILHTLNVAPPYSTLTLERHSKLFTFWRKCFVITLLLMSSFITIVVTLLILLGGYH